MKKPWLHSTLSLLLLLLIPCFLQAADISGLYIRYSWLGGTDYRITVSEIVPCDGQANLTPPTLRFNSNCLTPTAINSWQPLPVREVQSLCLNLQTACDQSPGSVASGWQVYTWTRDYTVDLSCAEYTAGVRRAGRHASLTNGSTSTPMYAYCRFKPGIARNAPEFMFELGKYFDDSASFHLTLGLIDADRDSLIATLLPPLDSALAPAPLNAGYGAGSFLGAGYQIDWDGRTGNLAVQSQPGNQSVISSIAAEVVEFADGNETGAIFFEMPVSFLDRQTPADPLPTLVTPQFFDSLQGGEWVDSFSIKTQLNQQLIVNLKAEDGSGDSTQITHRTNLPDAEFYNINDDPTKRRDTVRDLDPVAVLEWEARQSGHYSLGLELSKRPESCGPLEAATYQLSIHVSDTCIWVDFPEDTLYACAGDTLRTSASITGNWTGPLDFLWDDASQDSIGELTTPGIHWLLVRDTINGCSMRDTVVVIWTDECVWPGDANFDGIANNHDIIPIGLAFGAQAASRPYPGIAWQASPAFAFGDTTPGAIDMAHADTDGSGTINADDTLAIALNYNLTHNKNESTDSLGCLLYIQTPSQPVNVGDTLRLPVFLGVDTAIVDSAYGLAFSVNYSQQLVDSGKVSFHIPDSTWLGRRTELISIQHDDYNSSIIDLGISRTTQTNAASYGQIARLDIVVIDDIIGKRILRDTLILDFADVALVTAGGYPIAVNALSANIVIEQNDSATSNVPLPFEETIIYPSPARETLIVDHPESGTWDIELRDMQGRVLMKTPGTRGINRIPMEQYAPGVYFLRLQKQGLSWTTRVVRVP